MRPKQKSRKRSRSSDPSDDEEEEEIQSDPESDTAFGEEEDGSDGDMTFATTTKFGRQTSRPKPVIVNTTAPVPRKRKKASVEPSAEPQYADIYAECCGNGDSTEDNALVLCDGCDKGYHQLCAPGISPEELVREKWFCATCVAQKNRDFPPIDLATTRDAQGLSRYDKEDYLNSLPVTTLASLILSIEESYAPKLSLTSLPIWPEGLVAQLDAKKAEDIEARRIAFEQSEEMDRLEAIENERIEAENLELIRLEEMDAERGKAAATLTSLNTDLAVTTGDFIEPNNAFAHSSTTTAIDHSAELNSLYAAQLARNNAEQRDVQVQQQRSYDPYVTTNFVDSFSTAGGGGAGEEDAMGETAALSPSEVEDILNGLRTE